MMQPHEQPQQQQQIPQGSIPRPSFPNPPLNGQTLKPVVRPFMNGPPVRPPQIRPIGPPPSLPTSIHGVMSPPLPPSSTSNSLVRPPPNIQRPPLTSPPAFPTNHSHRPQVVPGPLAQQQQLQQQRPPVVGTMLSSSLSSLSLTQPTNTATAVRPPSLPHSNSFPHPSMRMMTPPTLQQPPPPPMAQIPATTSTTIGAVPPLNTPVSTDINYTKSNGRIPPPMDSTSQINRNNNNKNNGMNTNSSFNRRYPSQSYSGDLHQAGYSPQPVQHDLNYTSSLGGLSLSTGLEAVDLLQNRHILPPNPTLPPRPRLQAALWSDVNCSPDIFRCTLTKIPETDTILKKSRLPLGILIHPFKDLNHLPVIQCTTIVRCRQCRTYINPFVHFVDQRRWKCNICYRVNDLPEEFLYDPVSKAYGDPSRRPECKSSTIEFIAPSEYMLRPPQPAVYIFLLDVSRQATESGYLKAFCDILTEQLDKLPGDGRTKIGFITYDRNVHFYSLPAGAMQPIRLSVCDIEDMFLPSPRDLLVNLRECKSLVEQLLAELPTMFEGNYQTDSALGAALQAAFKMASPTGGRISIFQCVLPNVGPGALNHREMTDKKEAVLLGPATDFYKKLSLDCSGQQIAVDLFTLSSQYLDLATLGGISKFSGGQIQHFPGYHITQNGTMATKFENSLRRYLTRKIGFEAVMRVRCTRGLALHAFHGNFFVRSTDLLSLPNVNPDAGFGMQVAIEDDLRDVREVGFQAALLYTSSKGERRIRVHTLCIPTTNSVTEVINGADQDAIVGMLTKFASERAVNDSVSDAREGLVVSCIDTIETYKTYSSMSTPAGLLISQSLKLLPLKVLATMRSRGLRHSMKPDDRSYCFSQFKTLPLSQLLLTVYPSLYRVDNLFEYDTLEDDDGTLIPQPPLLQLSYERISATGMYLMDCGDEYYLFLCRGLHQMILERCLGVNRLQDVNENDIVELPEFDNSESEKLRTFINWLDATKSFPSALRVIREDGKSRHLFLEKLIEDRAENSFSYFEFLQHLRRQIK